MAELGSQLTDVLMRPAIAALHPAECDRLRARVSRIVATGRHDTARALVSDTIRSMSTEREIRRHIEICGVCGGGDPDGCETFAGLERQADGLLILIERNGGGLSRCLNY